MNRTHPAHRSTPRTASRRAKVLLAVLGAVFGLGVLGAGVAFGYWLSSDSSSLPVALAGSVGAGQRTTATVSGRDVSLSWGSAANAASYWISRTNIAPGDLSTTVEGTCTGNVISTSCTDTGLPENGITATTWTYTDTPYLDLWQGATSSASAKVTVPGPSLTLTTSSFTTAGGTTSATVSSFFDNEAVTYCLDTTTLPCTGAKVGTGSVPASGGTTSDTLTLPANLSVGPHAVYAVGSLGSLPAASITVTTGAADKLVFVEGPFNLTVGQTMAPAVTVQVEDQFGNPVNDSGATVTLSTVPSVTVAGHSATTNGSGLATFSAIVVDTAGSYTLKASSTGLSPASAPFTVTKESTTTSLSISATSVTYGNEQTITFTATVTPQFSGTPTGTMTVQTGSTVLCTITLPAKTCSTTATKLGSSGSRSAYLVTAFYGGDSNFTGSTSNSPNLEVTQDSTKTTVSLSPTSVPYGDESATVFSAKVITHYGEAVPNGDTITVNSGTATCTITPLSSGSGTCTIANTALAVGGPYAVSATFNGDANLSASTGTACARLTVTKAAKTAKAATSFAITVNGGSSATITYGAKATLAESGLPAGATGSITFSSKSPSATLCTVSNYPTSTSCQTSSSLATGAYTGISASFSDTDGDYTGSTSTNTVSLTVDKATLTVTASSTSTSYGTVPTVTASYSGFQNGEGTGSLTKLPSCSSTVTATSTVGTYPGANTCSGGAATDYSFSYVAANATVTKDSTTAKVSLSPTTVTYGNESQSVFTVTVTTAHGERLPTTDSATVKVGSASCIASLAPSGSGTCTIPNTALAANPTAYTVTASYPGDSDLSASSQATATTGLTVTKDSTKTTVSLSPSTVAYGNESQAVFTTKVTTHYGEAVPNGDTITVNVGSASCTVTLPATTCTIPNTALAASGTAYAVSATFNGDTNLSTSTGKTCTGLTITKAAPVITSANSATAKVGSSFSFQVTASGYPAPSLTESGKLPTGVRFNSATGVLSGTAATGTAGTYTLTFTATNSAGSTTQSFTLTVSNSCY